MSRRIIILAVIIAGVAAAGYYTRGFGFLDKPNEGLILYGNVDIRQVNLGFRVAGRIAEMPIDEGASVEAGATLAQLDQQPFIDALAGAEAQVATARAELEKRRNGNRPQEIAQAEAAVAVRRADMVRTREAFQRRRAPVGLHAKHRPLADVAPVARAGLPAIQPFRRIGGFEQPSATTDIDAALAAIPAQFRDRGIVRGARAQAPGRVAGGQAHAPGHVHVQPRIPQVDEGP